MILKEKTDREGSGRIELPVFETPVKRRIAHTEGTTVH